MDKMDKMENKLPYSRLNIVISFNNYNKFSFIIIQIEI